MINRTLASMTLLSISLFVVACDRGSEQTSAGRRAAPARAPAAGTDADNTARNKADRDVSTKTPLDQSNSSEHIKITADIRRAVMDDSSLSMNAKNCKIITDKSSIVTLRGPVESQAEKDAIEAKAKAIAGVSSVVNELEVQRN